MHRRLRSALALGSSVLIAAVGLVPAASLAQPAAPAPAAPVTAPMEGPKKPEVDSQKVSVVVLLKDQPTTPSTSAEHTRLQQQADLLGSWKSTYQLTVDRRFGYLVNGFSATMPADKIAALAAQPQVASVRRERVYQSVEHTARELEGVSRAYQAHGVDGTGTVISIIDSGIDTSHRDMILDPGVCEKSKIRTIRKASPTHFTCKVPDGYNYADENDQVKDTTSSQHGMHVAGIAAANGLKKGETFEQVHRVEGVAPNAQLLAMKVFSNNGGGAKDSDIIAAIEDSVKKHADVINMSLGSPNGQKDASDGAYRAIAKARENGTLTVVAAGNDGLNFSPTGGTDDAIGQLDDGTVGSPGTQGPAFTVASIDNSTVTQTTAYWKDASGEHAAPYALQQGPADGKGHTLVDVGLGRPQDYPAGTDLTGKYALIERGEISFTEKFDAAIAHHAAGIVVFNSAAGGDAFFGMAGVDDYTVFSAVLTRTDGLKIRAALAKKAAVSIRFTEDPQVLANPTKLQPSSFSSWGATPTLDFEPEISGVGGSVYSTLNSNRYGTMSGTSMASPNVAGLSALMIQDLAKRYPKLTRTQRLDLAATLLMNTAMIPEHEGVPYAPRQVGAGLAQVDRALSSDVTATVDGQASAALRQMNGPKSFTVTLTNRGTKAVSYRVPGQKVVAESNTAGKETTTSISSESLTASASTVTVKPGSTATVRFTLTPRTGSAHFIEGWAQLRSATAGQADLAVPYMGFVGDWNAEKIVSAPGQDVLPGIEARTQLGTVWGGESIPLQSEELGTFWLSPNGDGDMDAVTPLLGMKRNAYQVEYDVLDAQGRTVRVLGTDLDVARETYGAWQEAQSKGTPAAPLLTGRAFDGTVWNAKKADFDVVPDGTYTMRVRSRLTATSPWQVTDMPFGVDATAPVLSFGTLEGTVLPLNVTEKGSGLLQPPTVSAADGTELPVKDLGSGRYTVTVTDPSAVPYLTASALDGGFNLGVATTVFAPSSLILPDADALEKPGAAVGPASPLMVDDTTLRLAGYVSANITRVTVGGKDVPVSGGRFAAAVQLREGANSVVVNAYDASGRQVATRTVHPVLDSVPPVVKAAPATADAAGSAVIAADGTVTVTGTVTDTRRGAALSATVDGKAVTLGANGSFRATVTPGKDQATIAVVGSDGSGTTTVAIPIAGRAAAGDTWKPPTFTNADCRLELGACFVPGATPDAGSGGKTFTLRGKVTSPTSSITVTPARTTRADGSYTDPAPIAATIAKDGTFSVTFPVAVGENHVRLRVADQDKQLRIDQSLAVYFDVKAPTIAFDSPVLTGGTLFTKDRHVTFAGTASDDGWGYQLALNGSSAVDVFYNSGLGAASNKRSFSQGVDVADGDTVLVTLADANGNTLVGAIPVVVDQKLPVVTLSGVREGEHVTDGRPLTASAQDANLATMLVSVDGTVVSQQATALVGQTTTVEDVLIDARELGVEEEAGQEQAADQKQADPSATPAVAPAEKTAGPERTTARGMRSAAAQDRLSAKIPTAKLSAGQHTVSVIATDLAGNVRVQAVSFSVDAAPRIEGPAAVSLSVYREALGNQKALAAQVLGSYRLVDDGPAGSASMSLAPGTMLREGTNTVTLVATDASGQRTEKTVTVTIALKQVTLRSGKVTATSTFRSDDALTAKLTAGKRGAPTTLVVSNKAGFAAQTATITVPGAQGSRITRVLPGGREIGVAVTARGGVLSFVGPSKATYRISPPRGHTTVPGRPTTPGKDKPGHGGNPSLPVISDDHPGDGDGNSTGPGNGNGNGSGQGNGSGTGSGSDSTRGDGGQDSAQGPSRMPRTGTEVAGLAGLAALLLAGGATAVILTRRRRRG